MYVPYSSQVSICCQLLSADAICGELNYNYTKIVFGRGSVPNPAGELTTLATPSIVGREELPSLFHAVLLLNWYLNV